ncbi:MFS transporter [Demequina mangrovi]|uniref:Transmembrane secretion effector n=1 Tax=Demequina mangrovi TaxID=1043493 RepID=A0A1H6VUX0_9MICO|nr:MFS transporter [Demequina mangrovi]SEJ08478.1 Transmembrane secretion effector [Demequina mangrovi]
MSQTFASLRIFNYRLWFAGALVSNIGTWMQRVAQDWLVLTVLSDNSGFAVGVTTALQFAPFLLLSAWAGVVADRVDHRKLLIATQAGQGVLGLALGVMTLAGHVRLEHVYVFALLLGIVSAFDGPARQTFVSDLVPPASLPNAVGLNSASFNAARLIGPGLAGILITVIGSGWVFIANAVSYGATILALLLMRSAELERQERARRGRGQLREGVRYVRRRPDIVVILVVVGVISAFGLNFQMTSALMAATAFDKGAGAYGLVGSIIAVGSLSGALLAARRKQPRLRLVVGSAFAFGVSATLMSVAPTYPIYLVTCVPVGFTALTMLTSANATVQTTTSPRMRGRVMALYMMVLLGATPIGSPLVGWIGEHAGPRWSIGVGALSALAISVGAAAWVVRDSRLTVSYQPSRPFVRVRYPTPDERDRETRAQAAEDILAQQLEDRSAQP